MDHMEEMRPMDEHVKRADTAVEGPVSLVQPGSIRHRVQFWGEGGPITVRSPLHIRT